MQRGAGAIAIFVLVALSAAGRVTADPNDEIMAKAAFSPIKISGKLIHTWPEGPVRVFTVRDEARVEQGPVILTADRIVVWFNEQEAKETGIVKIRAYAESAAAFIEGEEVKRCQQFFGQFQSESGLVLTGVPLTHTYPRETPLYARAKKILALGEPEYMSGKPVDPDVIMPPKPRPSEGVEIRADSFDSWEEKDGTRVVVLKGNVDIVRGKFEVSADRVVVWFSPGEDKGGGIQGAFREVYAEGDVVLYEGEDMLQAKKIFQNRIENKGLMEDARVTSKIKSKDIPVVFGGKELRQIDEDRFELEDGYITTDTFGKPHFRFQSQRIRLIESKEAVVASATKNTFRVGDTPVLYWPFLSKDLKDDSWFIKRVKLGSSSEFGPFVLTDWDFYDFGLYRNDWSDATLQLDYYQKRGPAFGFDVNYKRDNYFGYLDTYYINDSARFDRPGEPVPNDNRGRALWRHRQFLPQGFRLDAEASWLSDRNFLREFFEEEFQTEKQQETMIYLRKLSDNKGLTLTEKHRINRFQTTVEETPRLTFDVIGEPIPVGDRYLNFTSVNEVGYLKERYSNVLPVNSSPRTWRIDSRNEVRMPFNISAVTLSPFAGAEVTSYDHSVNYQPTRAPGSNFDYFQGSRDRGAGFAGVDASVNTWRVYDWHNDLLQVNRLRHIATPRVRYETVYSAEPGPWNYIHFAQPRSTELDVIDRLNQVQRLDVGMRNRFQTKRGPKEGQQTVDWVNVDLQYTTFLGDAGLNRVLDDRVDMDFYWAITDKVALDSIGNEVNLSTGEVDIFNIGLQMQHSPHWKFYVGHRYVDTDPARSIVGNSVAFFNATYVFNEKWSADFIQQYDYRTSQDLASRVIVSRQLPAWVLQVTFEHDAGQNDNIGMVSLAPAGLKQGLFQF